MTTTREKIIGTAKTLLWRVGYEGMSPRMVMAESGAGQGSLYHHFSGKKDLAITALWDIEAEMSEMLEEAFGTDASPYEKLHAYLAKPRDGLKGCRLGRFANETAITDESLRQPISHFFTANEQKIKATLDEAMNMGQLRRGTDTNALATAIIATVQGGFVLSRIHRDSTYMEQAQQGALSLLQAAFDPNHERKEAN